jgi:hypothetical protein
MRDYRFWLIWASIFFIALTFGGAFINMPAMLADRGIPAQGAASVMGILGLGILTGRDHYRAAARPLLGRICRFPVAVSARSIELDPARSRARLHIGGAGGFPAGLCRRR